MSKLKRNSMKATNAVDPAKTNNHDWGYVIPGKGGDTQNSNIDPHAMDKELKDLTSEGYTPEHERYLGEGMVIMK